MPKSKQGILYSYRVLGIAIMIFCYLIFPVWLISAVFESKRISSIAFAPDMKVCKQGDLSARVNGAPVKIESYIIGKTADDIMQYYADYVSSHGYILINGPQIAKLALFMINTGMKFAPDKWYYLFYSKTNGDMTLITVGEFENNTRIVIANISKLKALNVTADYSSDLKHYSSFKKMLSVEILSGLSVISTANFYKSEGANRQAIRAYYKDYLPKHNWIIHKQYTDSKTDLYLIEKNGRNYILNIFPMENNEKWLLVMGNE